jgi:hypothetical protein
MEALATLNSVVAEASLDTDNVETVFGALEMAQLLNHFGSLRAICSTRLMTKNKSVAMRPVVGQFRVECANATPRLRDNKQRR